MTRFSVSDEKKAIDAINRVKEAGQTTISFELFKGDDVNKLKEEYNKKLAEIGFGPDGETIKMNVEIDPETLKQQKADLDEWSQTRMAQLTGGVAQNALSLGNVEGVKDYDDEAMQLFAINNDKINAIIEQIKQTLRDAGIEIKDEWFNIVAEIDPSDLTKNSLVHFDEIFDAIKGNLTDPQLINALNSIQAEYEKLAPSDRIMQLFYQKLFSLGSTTGASADIIKTALKSSGENWKDYYERIDEECTKSENRILELRGEIALLMADTATANTMLGQSFIAMKQGQLSQEENNEKFLKMVKDATKAFYTPPKRGGKKGRHRSSGSKSDDRLSKLQEILSTLEKINTKYEELRKKEGDTKALEDVNKMYERALANINKLGQPFELHFDMPTDPKDIEKYYQQVLKVIEDPKHKIKGADKGAADLAEKMGTFNIDVLQKKIDKELKELADRISRTKTAKEFYDKILSQTGNIQLAAEISTAIYGDDGFELQKQLAEQIRGYFQNDRVNIEIPIDVIGKNDRINYKRLGEFAEEMKDKLGEKPYKAIKKISEDGQKGLAKAWEGYFKDIEKAESYASKLSKLYQTTADKIAAIRADIEANPDLEASGNKLIAGLLDKQLKETARLEWDAFKDTALYTQMFEDLEHVSTSTLEMMRKRINALSKTWGVPLTRLSSKRCRAKCRKLMSK